jgi:UDP-glucuronate 4-epimerase
MPNKESEKHGGLTLVTGAAGFIGYHLSRRLLDEGRRVVGLDNLDGYYSVTLKRDRVELLGRYGDFEFVEMDVRDREAMAELFETRPVEAVVNLAAHAGVRHSLEDPHAFIDSNIMGFLNVLEGCRGRGIRHLVFASTSAVYGLNGRMPFSVHDNVDHPVNLYAATKKSNELMAHTYSHLFGLPCTGLRLSTVYGPWGRPDMALSLFTEAILKGKPIRVFNEGRMTRDFTYIDDVVDGIVRVLNRPAAGNNDWDNMNPDPAASSAPYRLYNVGSDKPVDLMDYIEAIEAALGVKSAREYLPMQPGDIPACHADVNDFVRDFDYLPQTPIEMGIKRFVEWYREYYGV